MIVRSERWPEITCPVGSRVLSKAEGPGRNPGRRFLKFSPVLTIATHCGRIFQGCFFRGSAVVEGIVSGKTPRLVGSIAFVVTLLVSGIDVGMPDTARADDCLTAPNSPAPQGTHWYYHVDRVDQRKCWYVRASSQPAQQATAQATSEAAPAAQTRSMPVSNAGSMPATAGASAPMSISPGNSAPRLPHARIVAVKPKLVAAISATTDKSVQGSGQEGSTGPSIPEPPAPKASTLRANTQAAGPAPARSCDMARCLPHGCYGRGTGARRDRGRCRRGVRRS